MSLRQVLFDESPRQNEDVTHIRTSPKTVQKSTRQQAHPGALETAVHSAILDMDVITAPSIVEKLVSSGYVFAAQSPLAAVNQVIRKSRENGILVEVEPGSGRRATKYKKASQTSQNAGDKANFRLAS